MKILYDTIELNSGEQPLKSFQTNGKNLVSYDYAINSTNALVTQNANFLSTLIFEIERTHQSEYEAIKFAINHYLELNKKTSANLILKESFSKSTFLTLENAILAKVNITLCPLSTITKYEFTGIIK
ncbi:MAG: hypothetical protein J6A29_01220 [Clostridia bacterium]|nr:hypothetical protein [Opitutales bacterium]MBO5412923.1 hypothetical protein [Clostridia bacterium]